ncbi:MAG: DNA polymerase III subunit delta' [Coriobacteriales bacterium]|nr:DNA polymerase III subunit delta' [Coriobacteriales bacterium]
MSTGPADTPVAPGGGQSPKAVVRPPFDTLVGQPLVARFLSTAIGDGRATHAYLFVGPVGSGKTEAAFALAAAILCGQGGGDGCDDCKRVARRTHPDVHVIDPLGVNSYLNEQVHGIIHDASLAPIRARGKVYIITRADLLQGTSANAFLKTLEEPLPSTTFILMARTRDSALETVVSRCQVLAFRNIPEGEAVQLVCALAKVDEPDARAALAAAGGSAHRAVEFLHTPARRNARLKVIEAIEHLHEADDLEVLEMARELLKVLKVPLDAVKVEQELQLEQGKDYLSKGALGQLEQRHKRELSGRGRDVLAEALNIARSWLRDVLLVRLGQGDAMANSDCYYLITQLAPRVEEPALIRALAAVDKAWEQIRYNVSEQLAIETMLFSIREDLDT